jgi:hypothetical protein
VWKNPFSTLTLSLPPPGRGKFSLDSNTFPPSPLRERAGRGEIFQFIHTLPLPGGGKIIFIAKGLTSPLAEGKDKEKK